MADQPETETPSAESNETSQSNQSYTGFSDGDLGQLQGILLGDHAKRTAERIDTLERALLGAMADMKKELSVELARLSQKLEAEETNRATAVANLSDRLKTESKTSAAASKKLQTSLDKSSEKLTKSIDDLGAEQRLELDAARRDLEARIDATEADLSDRSVDRQQLAALLSSTADELRR